MSYVKNARGERTYDFPGSKAQQSYEVRSNGTLAFLDRKMSLEGRVNLIFEEVGAPPPAATRVTANTRYVVTRQLTGRIAAGGFLQPSSDSISFNSNSGASFPPNANGRSLECVSTGKLEEEILAAVQ